MPTESGDMKLLDQSRLQSGESVDITAGTERPKGSGAGRGRGHWDA